MHVFFKDKYLWLQMPQYINKVKRAKDSEEGWLNSENSNFWKLQGIVANNIKFQLPTKS